MLKDDATFLLSGLKILEKEFILRQFKKPILEVVCVYCICLLWSDCGSSDRYGTTQSRIIFLKTFENRGTSLSAIEFEADGLKSLQKLWTAHLHGLGDIAKSLDLHKHIETVIDEPIRNVVQKICGIFRALFAPLFL
jgi:hypothetical protein